MFGVSQTTISDIEPCRGGFRYIDSKNKINESDLYKMFDGTTFALYEQANSEYNTATVLWFTAGAVAVTSIVFLGMGIYSKATYEPDPVHHKTPPFPAFFAVSGITAALSFVSMIPATILNINCRQTLCGIASTYNRSKYSCISICFGGNSVGLILSF